MNKNYYIIYTDGKGGSFHKLVFSREMLFKEINELSKTYRVLDITESCTNLMV